MQYLGTIRKPLRDLSGMGDVCEITSNGSRVCYPDGTKLPSSTVALAPTQQPTTFQRTSVRRRREVLGSARSFFDPALSLFNPPTDSRPVIVTSPVGTAAQPFVAYPAPGAGPVNVITPFKVDSGLMLVINYLAIIHVGGNPPDGTGNVVWRVLINGNGVKGLNNLNAQVGTYAQPNPVVISLIENDVIQITVEVPAAQPPMPPGQATAARFHAWTYPMVKGLSKRNVSGQVAPQKRR